MHQPRREQFILDVRQSARTLQQPRVETDSDKVDTDAIAEILHRAALWLTPRVVNHYAAEDFTNCSEEQQQRLDLAVNEFRYIAEQVSSDQPADIEQFTSGMNRVRNLIAALGDIVLDEWMLAIQTVEGQATLWAEEAGWRARTEKKKIRESLLGTYEAPQLLIFAEPDLFVFDPVARFVPGGQGSFDLAIQPSYYTTSLYRDYNGDWYVHLEVCNGVSQSKRVAWGRDAFYECFEELRAFV
ncbi:MAG: hypothetical protein KDA47_13230 [Planctomycetales bacterium]|nr:hypothetical protein [Planctomycetales bacterium]